MIVPSDENAGRSLARLYARRVASHALVGVDDLRLAPALRHGHGRDLVGEGSVGGGLRRELVRAGGERVLVLAGHAVARVELLGGGAHGHLIEGAEQAVVGHVVEHRDVAELNPSRDLGSRCGACVIDSCPPATTTSNSPARMSWSASAIGRLRRGRPC